MADEEQGEEISLADLEVDEDKGEQEKKPAPAATVQTKPPPVPGPSSSPSPPPPAEIGLADLERQIANERAQRNRVAADNARLQAERDNAIRFAQEAERRGVSTYELYTENQIGAVNEQMDALQAQQESAYGEGDFKAVAEINKRLNRLGGQLAVLERDRATLMEQREVMKQQHQAPLRQAQQPQAAPQLPADPIERAIANRTEPTKAFLRKHPELIRGDGSLKRMAIEAHERALDEGHAVDTPGYFNYIESVIGPSARNGPAAPAALARAPTMAAPVARSGGGAGEQPGTFMVTPKMRRLAEEQGVPVKEWVANYIRLLNAGRVTPIS